MAQERDYVRVSVDSHQTGDCQPTTDNFPFMTIREAEARGMKAADTLLWRAWGSNVHPSMRWLVRLPSFAIGVFGRSGISHAAKIRGRRGHWTVMESVQWHGCREKPLEEYVREEPGRILWMRIDTEHFPEYDRRQAVAGFRGLIGRPYGWHNLVLVGLVHFPVFRFMVPWFLRSLENDKEHDRWPPFCSQAVSFADRAGNVDPVPFLGDRWTEPGDLLRSRLYAPGGCLVPDSMA